MVRFETEQELLDEVVRRLVAAVDPEKIILFGSRARGDARPDSDYDFLVVKDSGSRHRASVPAYRALSGLGITKDIVFQSPADIASSRHAPSHLVARALEEGRVLYER
jgi:predicted nucleotidyltransferase